MKRFAILTFTLILVGTGCSSEVIKEVRVEESAGEVNTFQVEVEKKASVVLPLHGYHPIYKRFGEYIEDRFTGYHVGEDLEVLPEDFMPRAGERIAVMAIANGIVRYKDWVSGYGGVMVVDHEIDGKHVNAIYGHVDIDGTRIGVGNEVKRGHFLVDLAEDESRMTDGERKHLHFALYEGQDLRLQGYETQAARVDDWINPQDFFVEHGIVFDDVNVDYFTLMDPGGKPIYELGFSMPAGWDVEYIPSIESLNLYQVSGPGTALDRSQVLIRYFDASDFLTLSTVTIHSTEDLHIGAEGYVARRYDIEKKSGVADFTAQPAWRNNRHIVTDFRFEDDSTRYYVVAANPDLDKDIYEALLESMIRF